MAEPILKWAGGKRQILDVILSHLPKDYKGRTYHEPMIGAGAVFFATEPRRGTINDINSRLIRMYEVVRDSPEELIQLNAQHRYTKKYYYDARIRFNSTASGISLDKLEEASLMIYLNRTCWNGLFRENKKGYFNVPIGAYHKPDFVLADRIRQGSRILKKTRVCNQDFEYVLKVAESGDVVYFDPPYHPDASSSIFTAYHREGFDFEQQTRLRNTMNQLSKKKVFVILSNSDVPILSKLYGELHDSFVTYHIKARRTISCKADKRGKTREIIVSNVPNKIRNTTF